MGTKLAEMQRPEAALNDIALEARASLRTPWLSSFVKNTGVVWAISLSADALSLMVAHWVAAALVVHWLRVPRPALNPRNYAVFYLPFLLAVLFLFERNQRSELRRPEKELELAVKGVSLAFLLLVCANFVVFKSGFSRYLMISWYLLALCMVLAARHGLRRFYGRLWSHDIARRRTLLMGSQEKLSELQTLLSIQRYRGYDLLGIVSSAGSARHGHAHSRLPVLGTLDHWREATREFGAELVIVALEDNTPSAQEIVSCILKGCLADGIDVQVYSGLFASRAFNYELDEFSGFFRFFAAPRWSTQVQIASKKLVDFVAGLVGSLVTILVLPVIAFAIKREDRGPVFYRSGYVGPDGEDRYYLKFRSMRVDADRILEEDSELRRKFDARCKLHDDPRITRTGRILRKYSVDEFPSFFSILRGHISLVGPRTIMQIQKVKYGPTLPKLLSVKPGLTGFWQVMGRQLTTHEERVQMDMFYIDHWSIWLDLWIIAKTFWKVVHADGAY